MTTAATLLTETLIPAAKTAAAGIGAPGQSSFTTPFASLLAVGNFVQAPGRAPAESEGAPTLAALLSVGEVGAAVDGEDVPTDPAFNVVALFDSTSLTTPTPSPENPIPGLGLGVTTQLSDGASGDDSNVAPVGDESTTPKSAPAATDIPRSIPVHSDPGHPEPVHAHTDNPNQGHPASPRPALKGVTAADVMAEIAHLDPSEAGLIGDAVEAAPIAPGGKPEAPGGKPESTPAPVSAVPPATATVYRLLPQQASTAAEPPATATAISLAVRAAASPASDAQAAREGEAPDPRVTSQIAQSGVPRPPSPARATVGKAAAKLATGLSSALSGDVALAAMAIDTPKPGAIRPTAPPTPAAGHGVSETAASLNADANDKPSSHQPSSHQPSSHRQPPSPTGRGNPPPASPGQALEQASPGAESRHPMAEISDQQTTSRAAVDVRLNSPQAAPQPLRAGEAAVQPDRPMAMPTPPPAPPAEQVALQLRHAVAKGVDRITIQLSPASLGSIDVTLEVSSGARVVVHVVAERADTLDLLRADVRGLERALQEAGLRTDSGSLNFNLRGDGDGAQHQNTASLKEFDETATAGDPETDGDSDTDADGASHDSPTRQASDLTLDIEV